MISGLSMVTSTDISPSGGGGAADSTDLEAERKSFVNFHTLMNDCVILSTFFEFSIMLYVTCTWFQHAIL